MPRTDVVPASPRTALRYASVFFFAAVVLGAPRLAHSGVGFSRLEFVQESVKLPDQSFITGMGLRAHLEGGDLNDGLAIVPAIEYWRDTDHLPLLGVDELMQRDWRVGADLRYRMGHGDGWRPYGGAGLGLHITKERATIQTPSTPQTTQEHSSNKLAANFLVGVDLPAAGPIRNAIELNWHLVPDLKQFKINFGLGWQFGGGDSEGADETKVY